MRNPVECLRNRDEIFLRLTGRSSYEGNRCHGNSFVDDRNPIFSRNLFSRCHKFFCRFIYFMIDFLIQSVQIRIDTVEQADAKRNCPYVQILFLNHLVRFRYFKYINQGRSVPFRSYFT